ncbi:MAG: GTPase Der [Candidatus Anoxychlamydiales bacterium]|nr:GTPase Der [Candidatus Anoxychlamydiales bacterium]NGX35667.1 GTPase Der [Candidatus Anoxychlamydiales bacterium]
MNNLYKLAIVGRANVGKSLLFNRICKKKISIVHEQEGVTRDRIYKQAHFSNKPFIAIDTAGLEVKNNLSITDEINIQTQIAIEEADVLVMVVDAKVGLTNLDHNVARNLLKTKKRVVLAVNKVDTDNLKDKIYEFQALGLKNIIDVSAAQNNNIEELLELSFQDFEFDENYDSDHSNKTKIAIIGRTNVGKSTLINALLNEKRAVVSDTIATTRDSLDCEITMDDKTYIFIDTAGIRRKSKEKDVLEKFSHHQTIKTIERADICLLVLDAQDLMTTQDKKILKVIEQKRKGCLVIINKWDLIKNVRQEHVIKALTQKRFSFPILIVSATKKLNLNKISSHLNLIEKNRFQTIQTSILNKFIEKCIQKYHPPMVLGKRLKIYYLTQIKNNPPHFLFFVNYPNILTPTYKKYLINCFRDHFKFEGTPILFDVKKKPQH